MTDALASGAQKEHAQKVFIAASSEISKKPWLRRAIGRAAESIKPDHPDIELQPWRTAVEPGEVIAEKLFEQLPTELLGAIVILSHDDYVDSRGEKTPGPRDNLLLEAGLFLGKMGRANVLLLREQGSKWPSDLGGVAVEEFTRPGDAEKGNEEIVTDEIALGIETFIERLTSSTAGLASRVVQRSSRRLIKEAEELVNLFKMNPTDAPLTVPNPRKAYLDAVNDVTANFATTTYLDSEFWTSNEIAIVAANKMMLGRVKEAGGTARRLVLLRRPLEDELEAQRNHRRSRRSTEPGQIEQMNREFWALAKSNMDLKTKGFDVRVVYDRGGAYLALPEQIDFEEGDTEIALYDENRLDVFAGFTSKRGSTVETYCDGYFDQFSVLHEKVGEYFEQLWSSADAAEFSKFEADMNSVIKEIDQEIDYTSHWLFRYDKVIGVDGDLKEKESAFVLEKLRTKYGSENGSSPLAAGHIDLGTCTGRYMNEISPFVAEDGRIVGIDIDPECIDILNIKKQTGELIDRADVSKADLRRRDQLPTEKFPIVTCMMGTLCHLERTPKVDGTWDDTWQIGLENIAHLLSEDGDAFIAVWDERACGNDRGLLEIYGQRASAVLCAQTPKPTELSERVQQAGMRIVESRNMAGRLQVLHLTLEKASS